MLIRALALSFLAATLAADAVAARADDTAPTWNHADKKMTQATAFTVAPILPIPLGTLQIAKLSNGAKLVPSGSSLDLHDRTGRIVPRFDPSGRTLEPPDRPIDLAATGSSVVFLGAGHITLMTLPRPRH